jgi:hypothetical protein
VIRVVLAVALSATLLGIGLPAAEQAEQDRNAELATAELESVASEAHRLAATSDPVAPPEIPAGITVTLETPASRFAEPGQIRIDSKRLQWVPPTGRNRTVVPDAPIRVKHPIVTAKRLRVRLSLLRRDGDSVVRVRPVDPSV